MAVPNESPSQSRQHLEAHNAYDDESRQAEDDDWPTLISSIENGKYIVLQKSSTVLLTL